MAEKKEDRRTAYSKMVIRESLYELMQEKPLKKISVKEICDTADVNRCTFYAYYEDIYDLYNKIIDDYRKIHADIIDTAVDVLRGRASTVVDLSLEEYYDIATKYFTVVEENKELCKFIFNTGTDNTIHTQLGRYFFDSLVGVITKDVPEDKMEYFKNTYSFISGGTTAMIMQWLQADCRTDKKKMARQLAYYYYDIFNGYKLKKLK